MNLTDVAWVRDHQHRSVLQLSIDGHPAHIRSAQKLELTRRGIVTGIDFGDPPADMKLPELLTSFEA